MANLNILGSDGRCYTFDERANGYGRGEGTGVLILKRLKDAIAANDTIRAVIRATASNQDGHTQGSFCFTTGLHRFLFCFICPKC